MAGGTEAFERWLNAFYDLVEDGPAEYTAEFGGYPATLAHHRGLAITPELRRRSVALLSEAADRVELPADPEFRAAIVG